MFKKNLLIAIRSFKKSVSFSLINIFGLATGMAATILILFWVLDEINFDRFHKNYKEIYRVYEIQKYSETDNLLVYNTPGPLADKLKAQFPEFKKVVRFTPVWQRVMFTLNGQTTYDSEGYLADNDGFSLFTFNFISGSADNALKNPNSIVLSDKFAKTLFGNDDPVGKTIVLNNEFNYTVTGVIKKPLNTHLRFSFILPFEEGVKRLWDERTLSQWTNNAFFIYAQIDESVNYKNVEEKIGKVVAENGQENVTLKLEPLSRNYLYGIYGAGAIHNVKLFSIIAALVLLIACINFMNLSTARSAKRAKEVGLRKVVGGSRQQLIRQFIGESLIITFVSLVIALIIVEISLPWFNNLSGKELSLLNLNPYMLGIIVLVGLFTGIIAGSYPAFFLSSFKPAMIIKGGFSTSSKTFRKVLVIVQFTLSISLIIGTGIVNKQLNYMINKDLGFQKENILYIEINKKAREKYQTLKSELYKLQGVDCVTATSDLPNQVGSSTSSIDWEGKDPKTNALFSFITADYKYPETFGIKLASGRAWDEKLASDSTGFIINEEAAKVMGLDTAVGKKIKMWGMDGLIIGVVKNFHFQNLKYKVEPIILAMYLPRTNYICIRLKPDEIVTTVKNIETVWKDFVSDEPLKYTFFDQVFDKYYRSEVRMSKIFTCFSVLAVLISCLGLFGLATFMTEQRFKEIGIRKTIGATNSQIVALFLWEFVKWVLAANIVGWIIAYYFSESWLQGYASRINLPISPYIIAGVLSVIISIVTVSYQSIKASNANPVEALKYE